LLSAEGSARRDDGNLLIRHFLDLVDVEAGLDKVSLQTTLSDLSLFHRSLRPQLLPRLTQVSVGALLVQSQFVIVFLIERQSHREVSAVNELQKALRKLPTERVVRLDQLPYIEVYCVFALVLYLVDPTLHTPLELSFGSVCRSRWADLQFLLRLVSLAARIAEL